MRNNTRIVIEQMLEFLTDVSITSAISQGVYDALNPRPGAKNFSAFGMALLQLMTTTESMGDAERQKLLDQVLASDSDEALEAFSVELLKQSLRDPLAQVAQQFLAPQGIHNTFLQLRTVMESVTESPLSDQVDERIGAEATDNTAEAEAAADEGKSLEETDAQTQSVAGSVALESLKGGFYVLGHEKTVSEDYNPLFSTMAPNVQPANNESSPTKSFPAYTYCAFVDPMQPYARKEAALAAAVATLIPTVEWSRAIPYFDMKVLGPTTSVPDPDGGDPATRSSLSIDEFFFGSVGGLSTTSRFTDIPVSSSLGNRLAGMEAFTMPQAIIPTGKNFSDSTAFKSIDNTRPFMTVKDFAASVTPTRGTGSSMRATLNLTLHDRGRLNQVADLLKPQTLSQFAFDIEWGWSHPAGHPTSDNVYGRFINTLRTRQVFSLYQTSYSFSPDGQVDIKCDLVSKGVNAMNEVDCGTITTVPASDAVNVAIDAVKLAAKSIPGADLQGLGDLSSVNTMKTLGPSNLGSLVEGNIKHELQKVVDAGGTPDLNHLSDLVSKLVGAVTNATSVAKENIAAKVTSLTGKKYAAYKTYAKATVDLQAGLQSNFLISDKVANDARSSSGYVPLGAIIESFVVHPLQTTGMYDEIQLVSYTANLNAGAAAGATLGALPIDLINAGGPSFQKMMDNQVTQYGGQYPISRFIRFFAENFVEPQAAPMYGVVAGGLGTMKMDAKTGNMVPKQENKNLPKQVKKELLKIYYGSEIYGTKDEPRPTPFTPIKLKIIFDVAPATPIDSLEEPSPVDENIPPRTVLRIHLVDEVAGTSSSQGWMQIMKQARTGAAKGILITPVPRLAPAGMSAAAMLYSNLNANFMSCAEVCQWMEKQGILSVVPAAEGSPEEANLQKIETLEETIAERDAALQNPELDEEQKKQILSEKTQAENELMTLTLNAPKSTPYMLATSPTRVVDLVAQTAPNIVWGREGSIATSMTIKQKTDSGAATTLMMRSLRGTEAGKTNPNRGLPTRVLAADVGIEMFGNPLVKYMQQFFINTNTGTTIDNLYAVIGIEHKISKADYRTSVTLAPQEAYGIFESLTDQTDQAMAALDGLKVIKAQNYHNDFVAPAQKYLSEVQDLAAKTTEQCKNDIQVLQAAIAHIWKAACACARPSYMVGIQNVKKNYGEYAENNAADQWEKWQNDPFNQHLVDNIMGKVSLGGVEAVKAAQFHVADIYSYRINNLRTQADLVVQVETELKKLSAPFNGHPKYFIDRVLFFLIKAGAIPFWTIGKRGLSGVHGAPSMAAGEYNPRTKGVRHMGSGRFWFTDRFRGSARQPYALQPFVHQRNVGSTVPAICPWVNGGYRQSLSCGWFGAGLQAMNLTYFERKYAVGGSRAGRTLDSEQFLPDPMLAKTFNASLLDLVVQIGNANQEVEEAEAELRRVKGEPDPPPTTPENEEDLHAHYTGY